MYRACVYRYMGVYSEYSIHTLYIHYTYTTYTYIIHTLHILYTSTVHTHTTYTYTTYTIYIHYIHTLYTFTVHTHTAVRSDPLYPTLSLMILFSCFVDRTSLPLLLLLFIDKDLILLTTLLLLVLLLVSVASVSVDCICFNNKCCIRDFRAVSSGSGTYTLFTSRLSTASSNSQGILVAPTIVVY